MNEKIASMLDQLAEFKSQRDLVDIWKKEAIKKAMPPTVVKILEDINAEYDQKCEAVDENISNLEKAIKEEVLKVGKTVGGKYFEARYNQGKVSWDTKALDGMAKLIKEIATCRKVGDPYISIHPKKG